MTLDRIRTQKERQRLPDLTGEYTQEYESQAIQKYGPNQRRGEWVGRKREKTLRSIVI